MKIVEETEEFAVIELDRPKLFKFKCVFELRGDLGVVCADSAEHAKELMGDVLEREKQAQSRGLALWKIAQKQKAMGLQERAEQTEACALKLDPFLDELDG